MKKISLTLLIITLSYSLPTFAKTSYTTEVKTPEIEIDPGVELESEAKVKLKVEESKPIAPEATKQKALDYRRAFRMLQQQNSSGKIYFIVGGVSIDNVKDFRIMPNGTLIMLTVRTNRGSTTKIVRTEDITELGQR